jgi:hypothetical protein
MSRNGERERLDEFLRIAHTRRPWPGFFGIFIADYDSYSAHFEFRDYSVPTGAFHWFPDSESMKTVLQAIQDHPSEADDEDPEMEDWDPVEWSGPIDEMMHGHHPLSEYVRWYYWETVLDDDFPLYPDASSGVFYWVVRAIGEDDLPDFAKFLVDNFPFRARAFPLS